MAIVRDTLGQAHEAAREPCHRSRRRLTRGSNASTRNGSQVGSDDGPCYHREVRIQGVHDPTASPDTLIAFEDGEDVV